jgi:hypothetical protein
LVRGVSQTEPTSSSTLVEVHLLGLPVPVWARAQERTDELIREFTLIAADLRQQGGHTDVPVRLIELVDALTAQYGGLSTTQEAQLSAAADAGEERIEDLVFHVPPEAAAAAIALGGLLDEADEYCRAGEHLLTLASPPDVVRFRNWYLEEFTRQLVGDPATPWADYQS